MSHRLVYNMGYVVVMIREGLDQVECVNGYAAIQVCEIYEVSLFNDLIEYNEDCIND